MTTHTLKYHGPVLTETLVFSVSDQMDANIFDNLVKKLDDAVMEAVNMRDSWNSNNYDDACKKMDLALSILKEYAARFTISE